MDKRGSERVLALLSSFDFSYTVHSPPINPASPLLAPISEKIIKSSLEFSSLIDARVLVIHSGYLVPKDQIPRARALEVLANTVRACAEYADDRGVLIGIENGDFGPSHICRRTSDVVGIVEKIGMDSVGMTFDFGHAHLVETYYKSSLLEAIREALPYIVHVHISDNFGKVDPVDPSSHSLVYGYGDLHLPIGWGTVPYADVFRLIRPVYKGVYLLVIDPQFRDHYRNAMTHLTGLLEA